MICFDSELFPQNFVWQLNNDRKSLDLYYQCLKNKSSELWHTGVNRKARSEVEGEHDKSWNDHDSHNIPTPPDFQTFHQLWSGTGD